MQFSQDINCRARERLRQTRTSASVNNKTNNILVVGLLPAPINSARSAFEDV